MDLKYTTNQFKKFAVIGVISTTINYSIFAGLFKFFHVYYLLASATGYLTGLIFSYLFNRAWTFASTSTNKKIEFFLYTLVCLVSLAISLSVLKFEVAVLHINPLFANLVAIGVSAVCNFIGLKLFVFKNQPSVV